MNCDRMQFNIATDKKMGAYQGQEMFCVQTNPAGIISLPVVFKLLHVS